MFGPKLRRGLINNLRIAKKRPVFFFNRCISRLYDIDSCYLITKMNKKRMIADRQVEEVLWSI